MSTTKRLDRYFPYRGPCAYCDSDDARHRLWDAIVERRKAGESIPDLQRDYGLSYWAVRVVLEDWGKITL